MPNISRCLILFLMFARNNFLFRAFVTMITGLQRKCCWILLLHWIQLCFLLTLSKSMFFELPVLIPLLLYLIHSVSAKSSWIVFLAFDLSIPSSDLERINIWFMALILLALHSFLYDLISFSWSFLKSRWSLDLDFSSFDFK